MKRFTAMFAVAVALAIMVGFSMVTSAYALDQKMTATAIDTATFEGRMTTAITPAEMAITSHNMRHEELATPKSAGGIATTMPEIVAMRGDIMAETSIVSSIVGDNETLAGMYTPTAKHLGGPTRDARSLALVDTLRSTGCVMTI